MSETASSRLALARARVLGATGFSGAVSAESHALRAGRALVGTTSGGLPVYVLGWLPGSEPSDDEDCGVRRARPSPLLTLTFAACLGCCWTERLEHPWPGCSTTEAEVFSSLDATRGTDSDHSRSFYASALRRLRASLWLDPGTDSVRLGPRVCAWSEHQVDVLRTAYDRLPRPTRDART